MDPIEAVAMARQRATIEELRKLLGEYGRRLNASHHLAAMRGVEISDLQALLRRCLSGWQPSPEEREAILRSFHHIQGA